MVTMGIKQMRLRMKEAVSQRRRSKKRERKPRRLALMGDFEAVAGSVAVVGVGMEVGGASAVVSGSSVVRPKAKAAMEKTSLEEGEMRISDQKRVEGKGDA